MKQYILIMAMVCITLLELFALSRGINGVLLSTTIAILAGLAGLVTKTPKILAQK